MLKRCRLPHQLQFWPHWGWQRLTGEARTRILLWYVLLLGLCVAVAIPLMRYSVISQVNARVREDLIEDMAAFEGLLNGEPKTLERFGLEQENPEFQDLKLPPTTQEELKQVFQLYVTRRIPEDDTIFLTFLGAEFHLASVEARPQLLQPGSDLFHYFIGQTQRSQGEQETGDPEVGSILFYVRPIQANGQPLGVFVALHLNAGERQEAFDVLSVVFRSMLLVLLMALVIAWLMAGRVLAPLRLLAKTARTITETDLTRRIPVRGKGELADLAKTFNDMMDRVETAFATQRDFVNDAGHELRTPITIIRGHLEVMAWDSQEQKKTIALVINELDRMNRFVQDLLLLAKAKRPDFLRFELIDLQTFTKELFAKAKVLADRNWQLDSAASGQLVGDRQRLTEAVMNLAQNAAQYTHCQDAIVLGSSIQKSAVQFWVRDTGEGIAIRDQEHIFERFARVSNSRRRSEGAGLGLAIVRAITMAHGGAIHLISQPGRGSTFTLTFPLDPPSEMARYDSYSDR